MVNAAISTKTRPRPHTFLNAFILVSLAGGLRARRYAPSGQTPALQTRASSQLVDRRANAGLAPLHHRGREQQRAHFRTQTAQPAQSRQRSATECRSWQVSLGFLAQKPSALCFWP